MSSRMNDACQMATKLAQAARELYGTSYSVRGDAQRALYQLPCVNSSAVGYETSNFKTAVRRLVESGDSLASHCQHVESQCHTYAKSRATDPMELVNKVMSIHALAESLYDKYADFMQHLNDSKAMIDALLEHCSEEAQEAHARARNTRIGGGIGSGVAAGGSVATGILGFLFPPLWIASAALGATAVAGGVATGVSASNLDDVEKKFRNVRSVLLNSRTELRMSGDTIRAMTVATGQLLNCVKAEGAARSQWGKEQQWRTNGGRFQ